MSARSLKLPQVGYDCIMPNKPINEEPLDERMNFVGTSTQKRKVTALARQRHVSFAVVCRWAVDFYLSHGAPMPESINDENEENAS